MSLDNIITKSTRNYLTAMAQHSVEAGEGGKIQDEFAMRYCKTQYNTLTLMRYYYQEKKRLKEREIR